MLHPEHDLLPKPTKEQNCYEWMLACNANMEALLGRDYAAFVNLDCEYTMTELKAEIEQLAAALTARGFKKGDVIGVFLPTSAHAFVIFYALTKIGVICNFIHPLTPPDKLAEILAFTKSRAVFGLDLSAAKFEDVYKNLFTVICSTSDYTRGPVKDYVMANVEAAAAVPEGDNIIRYRDLMACDYPAVPTVTGNGLNDAVYMHSSGTTGKSKTVRLSSYALNSVAFHQYAIDVEHDYGESYSLCVLPCFHAFGLGASMHYCLCNNYTPIIMSKFDAEKANDYIRRYKVQYISGVPNMFHKMFEAESFDNEGLKNLNVLYSGGDIVSESFVEEFNAALLKRGSIGKLFRGWGLTEMSAICSTNNHLRCRANSVGPVLEGLEVCVLDEDLHKLPAGEQGEIALTGEMIMNGYLPTEDDDFDGFWYDEDGTAWVRTGDMGIVDEDGFLFFTGRKKRIIVISGYNIYPYSIEQMINALPEVAESCAVQGYSDNGKSLVKLCVVKADPDADEDALREYLFDYCGKHLNGFSVPRKIEFLASLPRTKMDKLDFMAMSDRLPE